MQRGEVRFGGPGTGTSGRSAAARALPRVARALGAVSLTALGLFLSTALGSGAELAQAAPCDPPIQNPIVCENSKPGNPQSEWDVSGGGRSQHPGLRHRHQRQPRRRRSTSRSTPPSTAYHLDIYRMGYYGGDGARKVATVTPSATLPQTQPDCLDDATTGLIDCGNWASLGLLGRAGRRRLRHLLRQARPRRRHRPAASHIFFIVRDDDGHSDLLFQTSDTTWQAYNQYGGNSLYAGGPGRSGRAYKVSYNRPFTDRGDDRPRTRSFNAEYPMVRWLERTATTSATSPASTATGAASEILEHKVFLSVGHDEYWSGDAARQRRGGPRRRRQPRVLQRQRDLLEDPLGEQHRRRPTTAYRTLVSYKETHANAKIDPRRPERLDRDLARSALQPAGRRRPARERADRHAVHGQLRHLARSTCRRPTARCGSGATPASPRRPRARPPR